MCSDSEHRDPAVRSELHAHAEDQGRTFQAIGDLFVSEVHHHYYASNDATSFLGAEVVIEQITTHAAVSGFVGREDEQAALLTALDPSNMAPAAIVVSTVSGMAGVGKTALARWVGADAVRRGWFPGGSVLLDYHGYASRRVKAADVFGPLLHAMGVPADEVSPDIAAQAADFHRLLAERARDNMPVLLIWDNVFSSQQIAGLVPPWPHRTLITSRHVLSDTEGARILNLEILDERQSIRLVREALRRQASEDHRIEAEPDEARRLVGLCGGLPLALRIAAALLAEDPTLTLARLTGRLVNARDRLNELSYGDNWAVRAALDSSYLALRPQQARLFRLLALNPGPHVSVGAAVALADLSEEEARHLLADLFRAHLIEPGPVHGTYRFHDLIRIYADGHCQEEDTIEQRTEAISRLLQYDLATSGAAVSYLDPETTSPQASNAFTDRTTALAWLETERPNLTAAVALAAATGHDNYARDLAISLYTFFDLRKYWIDWTTTHNFALTSARELGDRNGESVILNNLGRAYRELRLFNEAISCNEQALVIFRETNNRRGQGLALNNIGNSYSELRRFDEAIDCYQQARMIFQEIADHQMEGRTLNNIGNDYARLERFDEAIQYHEQALLIFREAGNAYGEAHVLDSLGNDYADLQRLDEAIDFHQKASAIFHEIGELYGEGRTLINLCIAYSSSIQLDLATESADRALAIFRDVGDRYGEGQALINLGIVYGKIPRFAEASQCYRLAIAALNDANAPDDALRAQGLLADLLKEESGSDRQ